MGDTTVSRRTMLWAGVTGVMATTGALTLAGQHPARGAVVRGTARREPSAAARPVVRATAYEATSRAAARPPVWAHRWKNPIYSIDDFTHRSTHAHFAGKAIMLTIDDGPSPVWTPRYLQLLAKHGVTATFCMIGSQVHRYPHTARQVAEHGHTIANHTWDHDEQLPYGSAGHIRSEIARTTHAIHAATGYVPSQFRAPGGVWGAAVFELARQRLMPLGWNVDPADWSMPGTAAIERAMLEAGRHDIILCHDGGGDRSQTYRALQRVIPTLLDRGYRFVTLPAPQPRRGRGDGA